MQVTHGLVQSVLQRQAFRQFVKFCIVGASSTVISTSIFSYLVYGAQLDVVLKNFLAPWPAFQAFCVANDVYLQVASLAGFVFAVTNGFFWNSRWTFRQTDPSLARVQYLRFVAVNIVGLTLNQTILFVVNRMLTVGKPAGYKGPEALFAFAVAVVIVVFWNFTANKLWTFKS